MDAEGLAPLANPSNGVSKMMVSADYLDKCRSSFSSVFTAIRELLDNMLAPDKERNRPDADGEPLRVELLLCQGIRLGREGGQEGEPHDHLRLSGNGQPIPADKVEDVLNLGHRAYKHLPTRAGCMPSHQGAPACPASLHAGKKIYGLFGHGSFLAVGALAYNAFWLCNHVAPDGMRTRWIALFGQAIVSGNQISHVVLAIPHGVKNEQEWRAVCATPSQLKDLETKLDIFTQRNGPKRKGLDLEYYSLFCDVRELLEAFDEMAERGETLRLDMLLAMQTAPGRLNLQLNENEIEDILEEESRTYLRDELLNWYMPQNESFALRQHLRAALACPLPVIIVQEQTVDWFRNKWQAKVDLPETYVHPVSTIHHHTHLGQHDIKVMCVETKSNGEDSCGGIACYMDSDRAIWAEPMLPSFLQQSKEDYLKSLSRSAPSRKAYTLLLKLLQYSDEVEATEGGLPSADEFVASLADRRDKILKKNTLFKLGGCNVEAYCMVDRVFITQNNLLVDSKDGLADTKLIKDMYMLVLRHCARVSWRRYKRETDPDSAPRLRLRELSARCDEASAALQGLIEVPLIKDEAEETEFSLPVCKRPREVQALFGACSISEIILNGPRKRHQTKQEADAVDLHRQTASSSGPGGAHSISVPAVGPSPTSVTEATPACIQGHTGRHLAAVQHGSRAAPAPQSKSKIVSKELQQAEKALALIKKAYKAKEKGGDVEEQDKVIKGSWGKLHKISKRCK